MVARDPAAGTVIVAGGDRERRQRAPAFSGLMGRLDDLDGMVITPHVLHTQCEPTTRLRSHGAHCVSTVKNDQRALIDPIGQENQAPVPVGDIHWENRNDHTTTYGAPTHQRRKRSCDC